MFLAIRDGRIAERNTELKPLLKLDRQLYEVIEWNASIPAWHPEIGEERPLDPRTPAQKTQDARERYRRRRLREYPSIVRQLDMMHKDVVNGTTTWVDEISRIKAKYPKPE